MNTTSVTAPGRIPPTSLNPTPTPEDSLVDVWSQALRAGEDPAVVAASIVAWCSL